MDDLDKFNTIFEKYEDKFEGAFHDLLWKLIVNKIHKEKPRALTTVVQSGYTELGLALKNEPGYIPTGAFKGHNYNECTAITKALNKEVLGLSREDAAMIIITSMRGKP